MISSPRLFIGHVLHRRLRPEKNVFRYSVFFIQLPIKNLTAANRYLFSVDRPNLLSFQQRDHGSRDGSPLLPWIQARLRQQGLPDDGEIVIQCFPRVFGFVFNPVSFWFCHNTTGEPIAVLAEVNNTFGGCHSYLLHNPDAAPLREGQVLRAEKAFHVSPFCEVEGGYRFRFYRQRTMPLACIDYDDAQGELLRTAITGHSVTWSSRALLLAFLRMPFLTAGVMLRIHWQALKLWQKGVRFVGTRSSKATPPASAPTPHSISEPPP